MKSSRMQSIDQKQYSNMQTRLGGKTGNGFTLLYAGDYPYSVAAAGLKRFRLEGENAGLL
jgi:hypothetical protein